MFLTPREQAALDRYITRTPEEYYHTPALAYDPDDAELYADDYDAAELPPPKPLTHAQCGRLGGLTTLARYGIEHFRALGKRGGEAYNQKYVAGGRHGPIRSHITTNDDDELPY